MMIIENRQEVWLPARHRTPSVLWMRTVPKPRQNSGIIEVDMAKITAMGGSLDVNSIVSQLMSVEREPVTKLQKQQAGINTKLSAWGTVKSALSALQTAADKLVRQETWQATTATSSNEDQIQVTGGATKGGAMGNHSVLVKQLAQSQAVATRSFASADTVVGGGKLSVQLGSVDENGNGFTADGERKALDITIPENATVKDIRDAINRSNAGISASLITDGTGVRLQLTGSATGAKNAFQITATGNGLDAFDISATAATGANGSLRTQVARDAKLQINGLDATSASNKVTDMIEGVTLNLKKVDKDPVTVSVESNKDSLKEDVDAFVKAYNKVNSLIADQTKYDPSTKTAGTLQGNATILRIQSQIRSLVRAQPGQDGLSSAGFELDRNGALSIKDAKLNDLLNNPDRLRTLFAGQLPGVGARATAPLPGSNTTTSSPGAQALTSSPAAAATNGMSPATAALLSGSSSGLGGVARQLSERLKEVLDDSSSLSGTTKALQRSLDASNTRIEQLNQQLARTEERLTQQYSRLDTNISKITSSFSSIASLLR